MSHNLVQLRTRRPSNGTPSENALEQLKRVMHDKREITAADVRAIAQATHQPEATVWGVATYYGDLGAQRRGRKRVRVCKGTACFAASGNAHVAWLESALGLKLGETSVDGEVSLEPVYCLGFCNAGPAVAVEERAYGGLTSERAQALAKDLDRGGGMPEADVAHIPVFAAHDGPAIVLERLVRPIDATKLDVARANGAYDGLELALAKRTPAQILDEVERSKLRGRGGAGFPTARKWRFAAGNAARGGEAYVVCNGDEGDPGSYIDKYLMEKDPFAVLEGITLAGYAMGGTRGYVYVRSEYPRSVATLRRAVESAREANLLGERILGSRFSFDIEIVEGAGSYVCGEETALLRSLEGLRGMVTARPPFPADKGLFERPTIVNNVETLANVGWIVREGGDAYARYGVGESRGTKAVSLNERFARPGVYEFPLGVTLARILNEIGGGMKSGRPIKAVQVGGPLGGILPASALETKLGFEELDAAGGLLGHGGIVAWEEGVDPRDIAAHLFEFCDDESCGKCFPCRIGGRRGLEIAGRLKKERPRKEVEADLALLDELLETMKLGSLCAHGGGIPAPIASLVRHFGPELRKGAR